MVVLITGASSGIGKACAEACAAARLTVYGTSRRPAEHAAAYPLVAMDVTDDASVRAAIDHVIAREGKIDALVNSAGFGVAGAIEDTSIAEAVRQFETNFFGVLRVCQAVLPAMRRAGAGRIINVSSIGGAIGLPFQGMYSASKFALEGLTESLRQEVSHYGIYATLIQPGDVRTAITDNRQRAAASASPSYGDAFERALTVIEREERGGIAPEAVARLVLRVIRARAPRVRYRVGKLSQRSSVAMKALIPSRLFERALMSYYRL